MKTTVGVSQLLASLNLATSGDRFNHSSSSCSGSSASAVLYNGGQSYHCFRCGSYGGAIELLQSFGWNDAQIADYLQRTFPTHSLDLISPYDHSQEILTQVVQAAHRQLMTEEFSEWRAWIKSVWGFSDKSLQDSLVGIFTSSLVQEHQVPILEELGFYNSRKGIVFDGYLIIPNFTSGKVSYLSARNLFYQGVEGYPKHLRLKDLKPPIFGYEYAKRTLNKDSDYTTIVVESATDAIILRQHGYNAVATYSTNASPEQLAVLADLAKSGNGLVLAFDHEPNNRGWQGMLKLSRQMILTHGVDCGILKLDPNRNDLRNPDLSGIEKIDACTWFNFTDDDKILRAKSLFDIGLSRCFYQPDSDERPVTFLNMFLSQKVKPTASLETKNAAFAMVSMVERLQSKSYEKLLAQQLGIKEAEVIKEVKATRAKRNVNTELFSNEIDSATPNKFLFPSQDYQHDRASDTLYSTQAVYVTGKRKFIDDDGNPQEMPVKNLVIVTVRQAPDGVFIDQIQQIPIENVSSKGINYPLTGMNETSLIPRWSNYSPFGKMNDPFCLEEFIKKPKEATESLNMSMIYQQLVEYFTDRVDFCEEVYPHILALYAMMTYCYMLFEAVPYIHLNGMMASGKSVISKTLERVAFNPIASIGQTAASVFRTIHSERGLFFFEEFESAGSLKNASESQQMMYQILNAGYGKESATVPRLGEDSAGTLYFDVYCPKVFISINKINRTLQSRCISIRTMPRSKEKDLSAKYKDLTELKDQARYFENKLRVWAMTCTRDLCHIYKNIRNDIKYKTVLLNRNMQLYAPLLAILKSIGDPMNVENKILKYVSGEITKNLVEREQDPSHMVLKSARKILDRAAVDPEYGRKLCLLQEKEDWCVSEKVFCDELRVVCSQEFFVEATAYANNKLLATLSKKQFSRPSTRSVEGFEDVVAREAIKVTTCARYGYKRFRVCKIPYLLLVDYLDEFEGDIIQYAKLTSETLDTTDGQVSSI